MLAGLGASEHIEVTTSGSSSSFPTAPYRLPLRLRITVLTVLALLIVLAVTLAVLRPWRHSIDQPFGEEPIEADTQGPPNPGYVGAQACFKCHSARVREYQNTLHYRACVEVDVTRLPKGFSPGFGGVSTPDGKIRFQMLRDGGDAFLTASRPTTGGDQSARTKLSLIYGVSGNGDEVYHAWQEDRLFYLPVGWLHPLQRWGVSNNPVGAGNFGEETTPRCLECHNTWVSHVPGTRNQYRKDDMILGVSCERCHGPGREHVQHHEAHPQDAQARSILQPSNLSRERSIDLCAQCHSNAAKGRGPPFSYRPGESLEKYYKTIVSAFPEDDHVTNQTRYMRESKCFQKSETLTCVSCHDPHRKTDHALAQKSCAKCHKPVDCREQPRLPEPVRANCIGCHMPDRYWVNVYFHTSDDLYVPPMRRHAHRIAVYPEARDEVLLAWRRTQQDDESRKETARLNEVIAAHWTRTAAQCRSQHRFRATITALREADRISPSPELRRQMREIAQERIHLEQSLKAAIKLADERRQSEAIASLQKVLLVKPNLAIAHGKLGTLYAAVNRSDLAFEHLQKAAELDSSDPYGYAMMGWLEYLRGQFDTAISYYQKADEVEPFNSKTNYQLALCLLAANRFEDARERFSTVIRIDPKHPGGHQGISHAFRRLGRYDEAIRHGERAVQLTKRQSADILLTLADALASAGRKADAVRIGEEAMSAAQSHEPAAAPAVRRRLEELRTEAAKSK